MRFSLRREWSGQSVLLNGKRPKKDLDADPFFLFFFLSHFFLSFFLLQKRKVSDLIVPDVSLTTPVAMVV